VIAVGDHEQLSVREHGCCGAGVCEALLLADAGEQQHGKLHAREGAPVEARLAIDLSEVGNERERVAAD
jgi:hypothetical protein